MAICINADARLIAPAKSFGFALIYERFSLTGDGSLFIVNQTLVATGLDQTKR